MNIYFCINNTAINISDINFVKKCTPQVGLITKSETADQRAHICSALVKIAKQFNNFL